MKDTLGNELKDGDLVALQLERPLIFGRISKIEDGGIVTGISGKGEAHMKPGRVIIESRHVIDFDPRMPVAAVLALRDDSMPAPVAKVSGERPEYHFDADKSKAN